MMIERRAGNLNTQDLVITAWARRSARAGAQRLFYTAGAFATASQIAQTWRGCWGGALASLTCKLQGRANMAGAFAMAGLWSEQPFSIGEGGTRGAMHRISPKQFGQFGLAIAQLSSLDISNCNITSASIKIFTSSVSWA